MLSKKNVYLSNVSHIVVSWQHLRSSSRLPKRQPSDGSLTHGRRHAEIAQSKGVPSRWWLRSWWGLLSVCLHVCVCVCSSVLQHPRFTAPWLHQQSDRRPSEQPGTLGLWSRLSAHWQEHSCLQEDTLWLLHMGCTSTCLPGWELSTGTQCLHCWSSVPYRLNRNSNKCHVMQEGASMCGVSRGLIL